MKFTYSLLAALLVSTSSFALEAPTMIHCEGGTEDSAVSIDVTGTRDGDGHDHYKAFFHYGNVHGQIFNREFEVNLDFARNQVRYTDAKHVRAPQLKVIAKTTNGRDFDWTKSHSVDVYIYGKYVPSALLEDHMYFTACTGSLAIGE